MDQWEEGEEEAEEEAERQAGRQRAGRGLRRAAAGQRSREEGSILGCQRQNKCKLQNLKTRQDKCKLKRIR